MGSDLALAIRLDRRHRRRRLELRDVARALEALVVLRLELVAQAARVDRDLAALDLVRAWVRARARVQVRVGFGFVLPSRSSLRSRRRGTCSTCAGRVRSMLCARANACRMLTGACGGAGSRPTDLLRPGAGGDLAHLVGRRGQDRNLLAAHRCSELFLRRKGRPLSACVHACVRACVRACASA